MDKTESEESIGIRESNSVAGRWSIYQRWAGEYKNEQVLIIEIFLCLLNHFFIQKIFTECHLWARQHAGHLAQKGAIIHYEVGEKGTDVREGLKIN